MIIAQMATQPHRSKHLAACIANLLPQVDELRIYLNSFKAVPSFLDAPRIKFYRSQEEVGDIGDVGKIYKLPQDCEFVLTVDDDIKYPLDYALRMKKVAQARGGVVGVHGVILKKGFRNYYSDRRVIHFRTRLAGVRPVHVLGTGTVGFMPSDFHIDHTYVDKINMTDVYVALKAQLTKTPMVCIHRSYEWLKPLFIDKKSIWDTRGDGSAETEVLHRVPPNEWRLY